MRRVPALTLGLLVGGAIALSGGSLFAKDKEKEKKGPHLRYVATYAEALAESKARNTILYAIFHKDH